jgi:hypothetical protein
MNVEAKDAIRITLKNMNSKGSFKLSDLTTKMVCAFKDEI